jgi:hypothetical protein
MIAHASNVSRKVAMAMIRPIFDPGLPMEVRDALLVHRKWMRPASAPPPAPWVWCGRAAMDVVRALGVGGVCAVLPGVLVFTGVLGRVGKTVAVTAQAAMVALWFTDAGIAATLAVQAVCTLGALVSSPRGVRRAHGHYLLMDDFDAESQAVIARMQAAIDTVTGSSVATAGLLDDIAGSVILSRQEWEIGQALMRGGNVDSVVRRVQAIERYAERVRAADAAYTEPESAGTGDMAESVALAEIDDLIEDARRVESAIRNDPGRR